MDKNGLGNFGVFNQKLGSNPRHYQGIIIFLTLLMFLQTGPFISMAGIPSERVDYNQKIMDLCVSQVNGEDLNWELRADEAMFQNTGDRAILRQINLHYFLEPGRDIFMKGDQAEVDFSTQVISVQGGIRAETKFGLSIETETLIWNGSERLISTKDRVIIRNPSLEMQGQGLEADLNLKKIKIKADAKTVIH
jgi:LPS export ABC transporter protein LptC